MQHRFIILVCSIVAAGYAVACGGAENSDLDGGGDATTNDAANDASPPVDSGGGDVATDAPANDTGVPDSGCSKGAGCRACCAQAYPDAAALFESTEENCACTTPGDCKNECANSLCKGNQPNAQSPCEACVLSKDAGSCFETAAAACATTPECGKFAGCVAGCGNGGGPGDAGAD